MNNRNTSSSATAYGVGALIVLLASVGVAAIAYGLPLLTFSLFSLPAWIFGPLGIYTLAFSLVARKNSTYYAVWGSIMVAIAIAAAFYAAVNPFVILGVLAIVIAIIGIFAYQKSRR